MGLGLLFIGYVLVSLFTLAPTFFLTDLVGSFIIYEALGKLRRHASRFSYAMWAIYALFAASAAEAVYYSVKYIGIIDGYEFFENGLEIFRLLAMVFLTASLLLALSQLAASVKDAKLADKGKRNLWLYVISCAFRVVLSLDFDFLHNFIITFSAFGMLFIFVCDILICVYIYSCYMWICLSGDHDMTPKPSAVLGFFKRVKAGGTEEELRELEELKRARDSEKTEKSGNSKKSGKSKK